MTAMCLTALGLGLGLGLSACGPGEEQVFHVDEPAECDIESQNQFVFDVMVDFYLWNDGVPSDVDLTAYESPNDLVRAVRNDNDRWSRVRDKATSNALFMEGKFIGLGYKTQRLEGDHIHLSFVSENSPASEAGLIRGDELLEVEGLTIAEIDEQGLWNSIYGEREPGVPSELVIRHHLTDEIETLTITKEWIDIVSLPVIDVLSGPGDEPVGYYIMDKFVETTKDELEGAYQTFKEAGIDTVIIDMRYNGGGLISVAKRQVDLTLGGGHGGEVAYRFEYNDNYSEENSTAKISKLDNSIDATKVIVLTSSRTLSASELVINSLLPYADVTLIGSDTGGKPVGSKGFEFCEQLLYPITFRLVNAEGNTDYFDGLSASCWAEDDLFHQIGDPQEGMLAAALDYLATGACAEPAPPPGAAYGWRPDAVAERVLPNENLRDEIDSW